eukprot:1067327-Alexandrium_andersonii.AAC.1
MQQQWGEPPALPPPSPGRPSHAQHGGEVHEGGAGACRRSCFDAERGGVSQIVASSAGLKARRRCW